MKKYEGKVIMQENRPFMAIKKSYNSLSSHQKEVADYIVANITEISNMSISHLAKKCEVSNTTVLRVINKLGYESYRNFKIDLARELSATMHSENGIASFEDGYEHIDVNSTTQDVINAVTLSASAFIYEMKNSLVENEISRAVEMLCATKNVLFFGTGGSASVAMDGFHKFIRIGLNAFWDANSHITMIRLAQLGPETVIILISHTGESHEVVQCAKKMHQIGGKVIALTSYMNSTLANNADVVLYSSFYDGSSYTDALVSRLVQLVMLDILYVSVSLRKEPESSKNILISRQAIASEKSGHFWKNNR